MESSQNAGGFGSTPHSRAQPTVVPSDHGGERQKNTARPQISVPKKRVQGKDEKMERGSAWRTVRTLVQSVMGGSDSV